MSQTRDPHRTHRSATRAVTPDRLGRAVVLVLLLATLIVALLNVLIRPEAPAPSAWSTVSVAPSGTLWEIAAAHPIAGLSTQQVVHLIQQENALASVTVHAGQVLRVPSQGSTMGVSVALR